MENTNHNFKKSLGQNFIFDKNLLRAIVSDADIHDTDTVLEIGAGEGTLTAEIASRCSRLYSFEVDKELEPYLSAVSARHPNLTIMWQDFMTVDDAWFDDFDRIKVVANLPYYITTPIIFKLLKHRDKISSITVMVQREVGERFASAHDTKDYGITSVCLQSIATVHVTRVVKKSSFIPPPKVDSCIVKIDIDQNADFDFDSFSTFVKECFAMRRKTLANNLTAHGVYDKSIVLSALDEISIDHTTRPEHISVDKYKKLFYLLKKNK